MNLVIAGPCGIGKSTVAISIASRIGLEYLDFDKLREADMDQRGGKISPCSVSNLNLKDCLTPVLEGLSRCFILDVGGDTIFRPGKNNDERIKQVFWLKDTYLAKIVLLTATRDVLYLRYIKCKNRKAEEFNENWCDWLKIGKPYWCRCADQLIDVSFLTVDDASERIVEILKI